MINRDVALLLLGAGIALVSSITTALVQHFLSIRIEKIKRDLERGEKESQEIRTRLTAGGEVHGDLIRAAYRKSEVEKLLRDQQRIEYVQKARLSERELEDDIYIDLVRRWQESLLTLEREKITEIPEAIKREIMKLRKGKNAPTKPESGEDEDEQEAEPSEQ